MKRLFDLAVSSVLLILFSPVILILFVAIRWKLGSPVLFTQVRPGLHEQPFTLFKCRTMTSACDENGELLPDKLRITEFGRLLRRFSLDEIPQLLNVFLGQMSIVGPRPLLMSYLSRYNSEQSRRHDVKPGITGWAQVNGRNAISWEQKFELDVWYVDHQSFILDLKILFMTIARVLQSKDVNQEGYATVSEFMGSGQDIDG